MHLYAGSGKYEALLTSHLHHDHVLQVQFKPQAGSHRIHQQVNLCMPIEKLCYKRTSKALCSGRTPPTCACTGSSAVAAAFITRHTANELSNGSDFCEDLYVMSADGLLMR